MPPEIRSLDPHIWRSCAGVAVRIPTVGSSVFYFPQGHAEQSSTPPNFAALSAVRPLYLCRIAAVNLLANPNTDEVFARIVLDPCGQSPAAPPPPGSPEAAVEDPDPNDGDGGVKAFSKILTPSDANNGGGFSVPRFCADSIFPPLDFESNDTPIQTLTIRDLHGLEWTFRHIYRGTPRRHLLTTGWSKFVNAKRLVAGDSVVFIRDRAGQLFVGIRRAARGGVSEFWGNNVEVIEGFSRNVRGRVSAESVVEAVRLAEMNGKFEVEYYPRAGLPDFVVATGVVAAAMRVEWRNGMRIKMPVEAEDSFRMTAYHGTVSGFLTPSEGEAWGGSPWRMLKVTWDEPEVLKNVNSVNPWQVQVAPAHPEIDTSYLVTKKPKVSQNPELPGTPNGHMFYPLPAFSSGMTGNLTPPLPSFSNFIPAGMQGARHGVSSFYNSLANKNQQLDSDNPGSNTEQKLDDTYTDFGMSSTSQSESSSPSQGSNQFRHGMELCSNVVPSPTNKTTYGSLKLFGQLIYTDNLLGADSGKAQKEAKGVVQQSSMPLATDATPTSLASDIKV